MICLQFARSVRKDGMATKVSQRCVKGVASGSSLTTEAQEVAINVLSANSRVRQAQWSARLAPWVNTNRKKETQVAPTVQQGGVRVINLHRAHALLAKRTRTPAKNAFTLARPARQVDSLRSKVRRVPANIVRVANALPETLSALTATNCAA